VDGLWATMSENVWLNVRAISFQDCQLRQTDRQTTCNLNTALCTKVHRAVKRERGRIQELSKFFGYPQLF